MQLTQFSDFSFRVLIYLARLPEPGTATINEISNYFNVSRHHLVKVVNNLSNQGFILTTRGKGGGLKLGRPAQSIGIGEVFRVVEPNLDLVECFNMKSNQCCIARSCGLKGELFEARRAFMAVLDKYTLADASGGPAFVQKSEGETALPLIQSSV